MYTYLMPKREVVYSLERLEAQRLGGMKQICPSTLWHYPNPTEVGMKSKMIGFVAAIVAAIGLAPAAEAGVVIATSLCTAKNVPPDGSTGCPGLGSVVGYTNLTLQLNYSLDVTYNPYAPPGSANFNLDAPMALWDVFGAVVNNTNRPLSGSVGPISISEVDYAANFENAFSVGVAAGLGGSATNANAAMMWELTGETPEPSTFILLGSALVGLAVYRRRANNHN